MEPVESVESAQVTEKPGIVVLAARIDETELARLVNLYFQDMVKYVVDVTRSVAAVGGELHADGERLLLEAGSRQQDLWGANYYPGLGPERCIEYTALINIRPSQGNLSMEIQDPHTRDLIRKITNDLIGSGEALS
jgi:hypothetical protein